MPNEGGIRKPDDSGASEDPDPGQYIDGLLALGWRPYLLLHTGGRTSLFEIMPRRHWETAEQARSISDFWMATEERRQAVKRRMIERGMAVVD